MAARLLTPADVEKEWERMESESLTAFTIESTRTTDISAEVWHSMGRCESPTFAARTI